jgi:uncharacterized protein YjbI with pentapeptide repeats
MANPKDLENALRYSELMKAGKYSEAAKINLSNAHLSDADLSGAKISIGNVNRRIESD